MSDFPLPSDPRHQRIADLVLRGMGARDAYRQAYPRAAQASATTAARRVLNRPDVAAYMEAVRQAAATETQLSIAEIKAFIARIVRTPITDLDLDGGANADLVKNFSRNEGEMGSSVRVEKLDPLAAIRIHLDITGEDGGTNAARELTAALAALAGTGPLHNDKL